MAYVNSIPKTVEELDLLSVPSGSIAVPYTVWSYERGSGRKIIKELISISKHISRVVTLSPPTKMAERFHIRNGALKIYDNKTTVNFEYMIKEQGVKNNIALL